MNKEHKHIELTEQPNQLSQNTNVEEIIQQQHQKTQNSDQKNYDNYSNNTDRIDINFTENENINKNLQNSNSKNDDQDDDFYNDPDFYNDAQNVQKIGFLKQFFLHVKLLLNKNYILQKRNYKHYTFLYLSPVLVVLLIFFWQSVLDGIQDFLIIDGDIHKVNNIDKCIAGQHREEGDCLTIGYAVIGEREAWIDYAMEHVAYTNNLTMGEDVKMVVQGSPDQYYDYLTQNANYTQVGVIFCTSQWPYYDNILELPCQFDELQDQGQKMVFYSMVWNWTLVWKSPYLETPDTLFPKDEQLMRLKVSLDNAIFEFFGKNDVRIGSQVIETASTFQREKIDLSHDYKEFQDIEYQDYPALPSRLLSGYDISTQNGSFYFFIPHMLLFLLTINEILSEKQKKLRFGICVMGMTHIAYWVSWFLTAMFNTAVICIVQYICCYIANFGVFTRTPFLIIFSLYFVVGMNIQSLAFFITTLCDEPKKGYTIAYAFMLLSVLVQLFFSADWLIFYLYSDDANILAIAIREGFSFYGPFHLAKIYSDIGYKSGHHFSISDGGWVDGKGFTYSDLFEKNEGELQMASGVAKYHAPTTFSSFLKMVGTCVLYLFITWYCDHVIQGNRGSSESLVFFLQKEYWNNCCFMKKNGSNFGAIKTNSGIRTPTKKPQEVNYAQFNNVDTVKLEKERVKKNQNSDVQSRGLRIIGLAKTYQKYPFGIKSKFDVNALKDFYLEVDQGELLAVLGHNGSGKSTLINVLTGILSPTYGTAKMLNYDIRNDISSIRSIMGVCPQFDILWNELTIVEHFIMFCQVKGIPKVKIEKEINQRLKEVKLEKYQHAQIKTLSGGQKRRVSLAISAIGNPQIIFMDEPTTGMDPKTRQDIWKMIKNLKKGRSMVLTTHHMEEADALSDRIAVISDGYLQCIGTSLYLKNNFGDGYRLTITCNTSNIEYIRLQLKQILPSCSIIDESGGSIVSVVPMGKMQELKQFFKVMESQEKNLSEDILIFKKQIYDWGLSHTTLEEVFMKITRKTQKILE